MPVQELTLKEYLEMGKTLYGENKRQWQFKCPKCGTVQTAQNFVDAGIADLDSYVAFSCIGRFVSDTGCNWTLGGLFQIHKIAVSHEGKLHPRFEFAHTLEQKEKEANHE